MSTLRKAAAAAAVTCLAVVGLAVPASSADATPTGYTTVSGEGGCQLATIDLATGVLTDLPAAEAPEACVVDLAATPSGQVWGITGGFLGVDGLAPQAVAGGTARHPRPVTRPGSVRRGVARGPRRSPRRG